MGAFVQPDEESSENADRGAQSRMFAAGVTNNFVVTVLAFGLLFGPVVGSIAVAPGIPVQGTLPGSPADEAGIGYGNVITSVGGQSIHDGGDLETALTGTNATVAVGLQNGTSLDVDRRAIVVQTGANPPIAVGDTITAVNDTAIDTERGFHEAVTNRTVARLLIERDNTTRNVTMPIGARVAASEPTAETPGPLNESGVPAREPLVIVRAAGERTPNATALRDALAETEPDEEITVELFRDGERHTRNVTLGDDQPGSDSNNGFLGVYIQPGTNGVVLNDFGIDAYPAEQYLGVLGGGSLGGGPGGSILTQLVTLLILPLASLQGIGPNFAGFTGPVIDFYTVTGPLSFLGGGVFALANVLFWTGWINVQLGFFNCIPAFPLDGGHLLRASTEAVVSRLPVDNRRILTRIVTVGVGVTMLGALLVTILGPQFLSG